MSVRRTHFGLRETIPPRVVPSNSAPSFPAFRRLARRVRPHVVSVIGAVAIGASSGVLMVRAAEDNGVREFLRNSTQMRRQQAEPAVASLPPIFRGAQQKNFVGYAPHAFFSEPPAPYFPRSLGDNRPPKPVAILSRPEVQKISPLPASTPYRSAGLPSGTRFCVRLCDGYNFPIGDAVGNEPAALESACQQACPATPTAIYNAGRGSAGIADAKDGAGNRYTLLPSAFSYRQSVSRTCSCTAEGMGLAHPSISADMTLRSGDLVMTSKGLQMYSSGDNWRSGRSRFVSLQQASGLTKTERRNLELIEASTMSRPTAQNLRQMREANSTESREIGLASRSVAKQDARNVRLIGAVSPYYTR